MRRVWFVTFAALVAAGCTATHGKGNATSSRKAYASTMSRLCDSYADDRKAVLKKLQNEDLDPFSEVVSRPLKTLIQGLEHVDPPKGLRARHEAFVVAMQRIDKVTDRHDVEDDTYNRRALSAVQDARKAASRLGYADCAPGVTKVLVAGCFHDEQSPNRCRPPRSDLELDPRA